ncbi:Hypothetical protein BRZCDTV_201 [Brazilian cedratvirus IHUMI]|uniref:Uncharacterized protein n=1 Tax=Brazilian cedratvirus IHUMI TaxID=2126980 RepID=A0A2R8FDV7_9VIRU|nr:Hypothetical protein BRZCDTV_201 [Brazilian cedratvirus IHUMI]
MQLEDYLENTENLTPSEKYVPVKRVAKKVKVWIPASGVKPLEEIKIGMWCRPQGEQEWFRLSAKYPKYITVVGESNQTMYINSNRYSEPWEYRE